MTSQLHLVTLSDITPNRATVTAVRQVTREEISPNRETGISPITVSAYAIVSREELVPVVGERVWVADGSYSRGEYTITARA